MVSPKWLLLAPPCVWAAAGLVALLAPGELLDLFPILWPVHDAAILAAVAGVVWTLFAGPAPVGPLRDEWGVGATVDDASDVSVETLLERLARRLELESRSLT